LFGVLNKEESCHISGERRIRRKKKKISQRDGTACSVDFEIISLVTHSHLLKCS